MNDKKLSKEMLQKGAFIFTACSSFLFIVLTGLAMLFYAGGTEGNPSATHYLFFINFFSDLGRAFVFNGEPNFLSRILFLVALLFLSLSFVAFFIAMLPLFKKKKANRVLSSLGTFSGIICALGFLFVGIVSLDHNPIAHGTFSFIAFIATVFGMLFYTIAIFNDKSFPKKVAWTLVGTLVISVIYVIILFGGDSHTFLANLIFQAIAQKIVVYTQILAFAFVAIFSYFYISNNRENKPSL